MNDAATATTLSIVIPAYNEAERLPTSLDAIHAFLVAQGWLATTEVIVVDDGSEDDTFAIAAARRRAWPKISVITLSHLGKGAAARQGMLAATGDFVFLCDADLAMPIAQLLRFLPPGADIAIGSREAPGSRRFNEPSYRHIMGRIFNLLVRFLVMQGIDDTQCGFKLFSRRAAHTLAAEQHLTGLSFDVELLALARAQNFTIREVAIDWYHERHSHVRPIRDTILMMRDVWLVRSRMRHFMPPEYVPPAPVSSAIERIPTPPVSANARRVQD
jgi:dolichyl-phosphate beta-glucosyltransferase